MARRPVITTLLSLILICSLTATAAAIDLSDDFTGGLKLPWVFLDNLGNSPPDFTNVIYNDADQDLKLIGSATDYAEDLDLSLNTTGYVGLGDPAYLFANEVHVTATFSLLENITLGFEELADSNNDVYVVARGAGLSGYVFALDAERAAADLVRIDDGAVVALGDNAVLRDLPGVDQEGTYTLRLSAVDNILNGRVYDDSMTLLGEVTIEENTYDSGWVGLGAAINDEGDEWLRTLIAARCDDFLASDSLEVVVPDIDELTAAINAGLTDSRYDIDQNGIVNSDDRVAWVINVGNTYFGDANLDGEFDSGDLVQVFQTGKYETGMASLWADGDWDGDGIFNSDDFITAFQDGGYEMGPRTDVAAVPEPDGVVLLIIGILAALKTRQCC